MKAVIQQHTPRFPVPQAVYARWLKAMIFGWGNGGWGPQVVYVRWLKIPVGLPIGPLGLLAMTGLRPSVVFWIRRRAFYKNFRKTTRFH